MRSMSQHVENPMQQLAYDSVGRQVKGGAATVGGRGPSMKRWLPSVNKLKPNDETNHSSYKRVTGKRSGQFGRTGSSLVKTK